MTIIAIMKDNDDPKLQMAAAKMLLDKRAALAPAPMTDETISPTTDDIDDAIALAKKVLDALAGRKTQELDGAGEVDFNSAPAADHPAR